VVELLGGAVGLVVDTSRVELERLMRSIDGYRGRVLGNGGFEGTFASRGDIVVAGKSGSNVSTFETASVRSSGGVRVRSLGINSVVGDDVGEGLVHKTTVATLVSLGGGAIDKVLLRKAHESSLAEKVNTFSGTSGGERPARSALTLVLYGGYGSLGSPVNSGSERGIRLVFNCFNVLGDIHTTSPGGELLEGLISEFVEGNSEPFSLSIMRVNEVQIVTEDGEALGVLGVGLVTLGVLTLPLGESGGVFTLGERVSASKECDEEKYYLHIN
jgi:hypothetical protein